MQAIKLYLRFDQTYNLHKKQNNLLICSKIITQFIKMIFGTTINNNNNNKLLTSKDEPPFATHAASF